MFQLENSAHKELRQDYPFASEAALLSLLTQLTSRGQ